MNERECWKTRGAEKESRNEFTYRSAESVERVR